MDDLISRQAAIVQISKIIWDDAVAHDVKEVLKDLPSAQPEIIRCKDCKYKNLSDICEYFEVSAGCYTVWHHVEDNDFCSRGERRTDGSN